MEETFCRLSKLENRLERIRDDIEDAATELQSTIYEATSALREASEALAEAADRDDEPLVLAPGEPQPDAPTDIALLPDYWDARRRRQGKPDLSRCAAELRIALRATGGER